jgi:hypothetical protein
MHFRDSPSRAASIRRLQRLARFLDSGFNIPGTQARFGADAIIGLVPGIGDFVTSLLSAYIVMQAVRLGASGKTVAMMIGNILLDFVIGAIPGIGDVADFFFKSNQRNLQLMAKDPVLAAEFDAHGGMPEPRAPMANVSAVVDGLRGSKRVVNEAA